MRPPGLLVLAALAATPVGAQVVSPAPEATAVTVYRLDGEPAPDEDVRLDEIDPWSGLAMIRETRTVDLPAGRSRISFRGVADTMVPQTAAVEGLPGAVIERNQDYNLLTPGALVEASVGQPVTLVRTNPKTGLAVARPAVLRAGARGPVLEVDGKVEAFGCSGAPERLVFDRIPPGLADQPTFSVLADVPRAGRYPVRLSYLATGLAWSADYVARIAPDGRTLDLTGWVTLANQTSASFADAPTDVVAGKLSRDEGETVAPRAAPTPLIVRCWPTALAPPPPPPPLPVPMVARRMDYAPDLELAEVAVTAQKLATQSDLGDYKLYTLPEPTTVAARQTKQVMFLDQKAVPFTRLYTYDTAEGEGDGEPEPARAVLRLKNDKAAGLGKPLPAGAVAVMEPGAGGAPVLAGQRRVKDTPVGLPLEVELGAAMDVWVTVTLGEDREKGDRTKQSFAVTFENAKPAPVIVEYLQRPLGEDFRVTSASRRAGRKNGGAVWTISLAPGERASLTYDVAYR